MYNTDNGVRDGKVELIGVVVPGGELEDGRVQVPRPILEAQRQRRGEVEARGPRDAAVADEARALSGGRGRVGAARGRAHQRHVGQPQPLGRHACSAATPRRRVPFKPRVFPALLD